MSFWKRFKQSLMSTDRAPIPALCVPPAARPMLRNVDADLRRKYGLADEENVRFVQLSAEPNTYRDAICCRNGTEWYCVFRICQSDRGPRCWTWRETRSRISLSKRNSSRPAKVASQKSLRILGLDLDIA
jgi:hypothetical protein